MREDITLTASVLAHPSRAELARRLVDHAPDGLFSLVWDPEPDGPPTTLRTVLAAWSSVDPSATHHLVVQDDMILSPWLIDRARKAAAAMPEAALSFFSLWDSRNGGTVRLGALAGTRWATAASEYTPSAVLLLPREVAAGYVDFARRRLSNWPDDILMHQYLREAGIARFVAVPNAAEHADIASIAGNGFRGPRRSSCLPAQDLPGPTEDSRLVGPSVIPFIKHGRAQCSVLVTESAPGRWHDVPTERYLSGVGIPTVLLDREFAATGAGIAREVWLTGFALGVVRQLDIGAVVSGARLTPDRSTVSAALGTIGPGGLCHERPEREIEELRDALAETAERGLQAGDQLGSQMRGGTTSAAGALPVRIGIGGGAGPLADYVIRGLRDHGWQVMAITEKGLACDVVFDLDNVQPHSTGAGEIAVAWNTAERQLLPIGDLYGPGCSPQSRIGILVFAAVLGRSLLLTDDPATLVHPLHVEDLVSMLDWVVRTRPPAAVLHPPRPRPRRLGEITECTQRAVRPVRLEFATKALVQSGPAPYTVADDGFIELEFGLHTFAQWLKHETAPMPADSP
ncbi:hypothetical protein ACTXG5_07405 [Mycobacterium sp. Dal123C01]|uniref:hypothetical protein n=1 Tax=Mycobacterium sp. Dal123C01 TaxID=3457577 RepID=UPI00403EED84